MSSIRSTLAWSLVLSAACPAVGREAAWAQALAPDQGPTAPAPTVPQPPFLIVPSLTIQETYTDNADLSPTNRRPDWITRGMLSVDADVNTGRTTLVSHGDFAYDRYADRVSMSGWSLSALGSGAYQILPDRLSLNVQGTVTDGYVSTIDTSATDRSGLANRVQLATYALGPQAKLPVADIGELNAAARFSQVFYSPADASTVTDLPNDDDIVQVIGSFDTGKLHSGYQSLTTFEFDGDNQDYRSVNGIESLFVRVAPSVRVLGRAGYESVSQPGITNINAPVASAGLEYQPNDKSLLTVEGGTRFNRGVWAAKGNIQLSSRLSLTADYSVAVQPDQVYVANTLSDFIARTVALPSPIVPGSFRYTPNLYNQTSLNNTADLHLIYAGGVQSVDVSANWADRDFLAHEKGHDRTFIANVSYTRRVKPLLDVTVQGNYAHTLESPLFGANETYRASVMATYRLTRQTNLTASYNFSSAHEFTATGFRVHEHAVAIAITRRF